MYWYILLVNDFKSKILFLQAWKEEFLSMVKAWTEGTLVYQMNFSFI